MGVIAPFIYIYKQKRRWVPWLYLYGASRTGKTTLGEIILALWGLDSRYRKSGSNIDTVPRLGHVLAQSTFPVLINEPGAAISREDVVETIKSAIESTIARGKFVRGTYMEIPALSPLILTSNKVLPRDDALLRRFIIIRFTYGEKVDSEKEIEFNDNVKPRFVKLAALGYWVAKKVVENPDLLDLDWKDLATRLIEEAYRETGLEIPEWIYLWHIIEIYSEEDQREAIRNYLIRRINEEYEKFVGRVVVSKDDGLAQYLSRSEVDFEERIKLVLQYRLLPWAIMKDNDVVITSGLVYELEKVVGDIGGLKSLAELLGWNYTNVKLEKNKVIKAIRISIHDFIEFLNPRIEL